MNKTKVASVFKWEFLKHLRSPVFLLFTFLLPALMAVSGFLPGLVMERMSVSEKNLWILDETNELAPFLEAGLAQSKFISETVQGEVEDLKEKIGAGEADGLLHITANTLATGQLQLYANDLKDFSRQEVEQLVQPAFTQYRLQISGISPEEFSSILLPSSLQLLSVRGEEDNVFAFIIPLITGMFLFMSVLFSGQILMQSVIKEKRNRIIEILLSSLSARELLAGKVLAFGALSLIQIGIWLGVGLTVASQFIDLSAIGLDYTQFFISLPYLILGYFLLSTMFAACAATMKDAESGSQAHGLVIMIPILPLMFSTPIMMAPNGAFARILSFIPIFTPGTMLIRIGSTTIPIWELCATSVVLLISTFFFLKIAARIYEGSLLKYDAAASLREIIGMLKKDRQ